MYKVRLNNKTEKTQRYFKGKALPRLVSETRSPHYATVCAFCPTFSGSLGLLTPG